MPELIYMERDTNNLFFSFLVSICHFTVGYSQEREDAYI